MAAALCQLSINSKTKTIESGISSKLSMLLLQVKTRHPNTVLDAIRGKR